MSTLGLKGIKKGTGMEAQIIAYFRANPDEELTIDDIAAKWGRSRQRARNAVARLRQYGIGRVVVVRMLPENV